MANIDVACLCGRCDNHITVDINNLKEELEKQGWNTIAGMYFCPGHIMEFFAFIAILAGTYEDYLLTMVIAVLANVGIEHAGTDAEHAPIDPNDAVNLMTSIYEAISQPRKDG